MSAWALLVREVHQAGGNARVSHLGLYDDQAMFVARKLGLLEPGKRGRDLASHRAVITQRGRDFVEGRLTLYVPYFGHGTNGGRAKNSHRRWKATWLAALPRTNEVRLTQAVHPAQNDGTCYW